MSIAPENKRKNPPSMSEVEQIMAKFHFARHAERHCGRGQEPVVCVAGHISYLELENALALKYDLIATKSATWTGYIELLGVKIYKSGSIEEGFYFGHIEPKP